jgi:hypothetical protein
MLLEKERERLLAVLRTRTSTHAERVQARQALEADGTAEDDVSSMPRDENSPTAQTPETDA